MGAATDSPQRGDHDGDITVAHIVLPLPQHPINDANDGCHLRHDLQCRVWLLLGSDSVAVPSGNPAAEDPLQGRELVDGYELGLQLAGWRNDPYPAGVDSVEVVSPACILLRR